MSLKKIMIYGNPVLRKKTEKITKISDSVKTLVKDMFETVKIADGIGLAAPQVGVSKSLFIVDLSHTELKSQYVMINPVITRRYGPLDVYHEGCLSFPKLYADVTRHSVIDITYTDIDSKKVTLKNVDGLLARVIQHEMDHLNGVLFVDKISEQDKSSMESELENLKKISNL